MAEGGAVTYLYTCEICGQEDLDEAEMKTHVQVEHVDGNISCPFCDLQGITFEEMNLHVNSAHLDFVITNGSSELSPENSDGANVELSMMCSVQQEKKNLLRESVCLDDLPKSVSEAGDLSLSEFTTASPTSAITSPSSATSDDLQVFVSPILEDGWELIDLRSIPSEADQRGPMGTSHSTCGGIFKSTADTSLTDDQCETVPVPMDISVEELKPEIKEPPCAMRGSYSLPKLVDPMMMSISTTGSETVTSPDRSMGTSESSDSLQSDSSSTIGQERLQKDYSRCQTDNDAIETNNGQDNLRSKLSLSVPYPFSPRKSYMNGAIPKTTDNPVLRLSPVAPLDNLACAATPKDLLFCPLCDWTTTNPNEIQDHVNLIHLDIISPAKPVRKGLPSTTSQKQSISVDNAGHMEESKRTKGRNKCQFECPICCLLFENATLLEIHVNSKHVDILSPDVVPVTENLQSPGCPVCGMEFTDSGTLNSHVNGHFSTEQTPVTVVTDNLLAQEMERRDQAASKLQEQKEFEKLQAEHGMDGKTNLRKQATTNLHKAVSNGRINVTEYYDRIISLHQSTASGVDDGHSKTTGIMARLQQYYIKRSPNILNVYLCSHVDHYAASYGDRGWGCGYRNLQMILSSLAHNTTYHQVLFNGRPLVPSIPKIQQLLEAAWSKGFDAQGCEQLGGKVVDTNKWIGATEIVAILSSLKVKGQLVDFHHPTDPDGAHPKLFEWVRNYFRKSDAFKPPLYLQHQGHSRTIVGLEEHKGGIMKLLIFDPSCSKKQMQLFHGDINCNLMRTLRRTCYGLKAKQYQIVYVNGILSEQEYQESKILKSDRIP